jgi:hypothetical protein
LALPVIWSYFGEGWEGVALGWALPTNLMRQIRANQTDGILREEGTDRTSAKVSFFLHENRLYIMV